MKTYRFRHVSEYKGVQHVETGEVRANNKVQAVEFVRGSHGAGDIQIGQK